LSNRRTPFPRVFWVANSIEVLERFAYYGIYMGFGIYLTSLGYSRDQLGWVQSVFLLFSYFVPVISGTFADRYGFKKVLIVSYLAYLPAILLLTFTRTFSGIALTMLTIGLAAGIFKPLIAGTVRAVSDSTNKTMGFAIFYAMVNAGATLGPIVAGKLRAISWNHAFTASAVAIGLMLVVTVLFYEEPPRALEAETLGQKLRGIGVALSDPRFLALLALLGFFFWLPFWAFFNLAALYVDGAVDTARLYQAMRVVLEPVPWLGPRLLDLLSHEEGGVRRVLGESISHTGYIIVVFQVLVSRYVERARAMPAFIVGLVVAAAGFVVIGLARVSTPPLVFLGIFLFAVGEMITSPRIQEYITWIAPKEKAGLYMGSNFLATAVGAFVSGPLYTSFVYDWAARAGHAERAWYVLAGHLVLAAAVFLGFVRLAGEFRELDA
jgi:dipeptide/tripeptide permease